jgi:Na+:H+ antiporter, NhaA family
MSTRPTLAFLRTETGSAVLLALAAGFAIAWANSPWAGDYEAFVGQVIPVQLGPFREVRALGDWVQTLLMPVFFFVLGLQMKHEIVRGELSSPRRLALPVLAAIGGIAAPAAIYLALNLGGGGRTEGWPAAAATDIALALAVLAVAGARLPATLRVFLLTVAIVDDLAAVALIAVLFSDELRPTMLVGAAATLALLAAMSRWRGAPYFFWAVGGLILWGFTLKSGVNTSIAGVAAAFCMPLEPKRPGRDGVLTETMEALHPYVAFLILPLFALTAAGFPIWGASSPDALGPVSLGVAAALVFGKTLGVFGAAMLAIGLKWARRPTGARWLELLGVSALCGMGFTLALYVGGLAFPAQDLSAQTQLKAGVVMGSLASGLLGLAVLAASAARRRPS